MTLGSASMWLETEPALTRMQSCNKAATNTEY